MLWHGHSRGAALESQKGTESYLRWQIVSRSHVLAVMNWLASGRRYGSSVTDISSPWRVADIIL